MPDDESDLRFEEVGSVESAELLKYLLRLGNGCRF